MALQDLPDPELQIDILEYITIYIRLSLCSPQWYYIHVNSHLFPCNSSLKKEKRKMIYLKNWRFHQIINANERGSKSSLKPWKENILFEKEKKKKNTQNLKNFLTYLPLK